MDKNNIKLTIYLNLKLTVIPFLLTQWSIKSQFGEHKTFSPKLKDVKFSWFSMNWFSVIFPGYINLQMIIWKSTPINSPSFQIRFNFINVYYVHFPSSCYKVILFVCLFYLKSRLSFFSTLLSRTQSPWYLCWEFRLISLDRICCCFCFRVCTPFRNVVHGVPILSLRNT